ncbi:MAG: hypothetical protein KAG61_10325 [Bacteriovoracaceae bacterium]|nr:hypothetical protein [Bacteriovoracaceae bacterium]
MRNIGKAFLISSLIAASLTVLAANKATKKVIKYRKHTTVDLTGSVIKSKARTPDVFYIFRRKRTSGGKLKKLPQNFNYHRAETLRTAQRIMK